MEIKLVPISDVKPYDNNPRNHDVDAIAKSLKEFGWRQPIVVDTDLVIIVGHGRFYASNKLGLTTVPIHVAKDLSPEQVKAYRLADNQTNELATWDFALLAGEIEALQDVDYDISVLGFSLDDLAKIMHGQTSDGLTDPNEIPAVGTLMMSGRSKGLAYRKSIQR